MKLGLNIVANGAHAAGWRMPDAQADAALDIKLWKRIAQAAEAARIHFMFWADGIAVRSSAKDEDELSYLGRIDVFEPISVIGYLSAVTDHLGFVASASTTYNEPYHIARKFASLDWISQGRVGWNVVTSWSEDEALNFGRDRHMEHGLRYRRAEEFIDVVMGLWDEWEDDAFIRDKASGRYFDPAKLHTLHHKGESFSVRGPLNVARPVQGYPVIAQAGSSGPGQDLGSRIADLIYTAQKSARRRHRLLPQRQAARCTTSAATRTPCSSCPASCPSSAAPSRSRRHARAAAGTRPPQARPAPSSAPRSATSPTWTRTPGRREPLADHNGVKSNHEALARLVRGKGMTVRELYRMLAGTSGHNRVIGTVETHRRPDGGLVREPRLRRLEPDAPLSSRPGLPHARNPRPRAAAPRPVPHRIRRHDPARKPRPDPAGAPLAPGASTARKPPNDCRGARRHHPAV